MVEPAIRQIGRYQLLDVIGQGGMGVVWRAYEASMARTVAIKMLRGAVEDKDLLERFHREVRSTANLQHKNIVTVYTLDEFEGFPYMVMEYLEGQSIAEIIKSQRPVSLAEKIDIICQLCDGLQYAHDRSVIHRDIKPANILIVKDGRAKIVDFGIARMNHGDTLTQTGQIIGSTYYMSPEQINGQNIDTRSDIYSAGVTLFEFLTSTVPFKSEDPTGTFFKILNDPIPSVQSYFPDTGAVLDAILAKAMAKDVEERYQTAEEFGYDLSRLLETLKRGMVEEYLAQAQAAIDRKQWEVARQQVQEIIKFDRRHVRANQLLQVIRNELQRQQRSELIEQLQSRAEVAFAGRQYDEALDCLTEARRLDPENPQLQTFYDSIKTEVDRMREVAEALRRGQASYYAGDLNDAQVAVEQALKIKPDYTEAIALDALIQKDIAERAKKAKLQGFVDDARREISKHNFVLALQALQQAQEIDSSDSNVRDLINWAARGHEQEKLRKELQRVTDEIGQLIAVESYSQAVEACQAGLQRFPDDPSLIKLQQLAKRQSDVAERKSRLELICAEARRLADAGQDEEALECLERGLVAFPNDPSLETLLTITRADAERKLQEQEERGRSRELFLVEQQAESSATGAREHLPALLRSFQEGLARKLPIAQLSSLQQRIAAFAEEKSLSNEESSQYQSAMTQFEIRISAWRQDCGELDALAVSLERARSSAEILAQLERARAVAEQYGKDEEVRGKYKKIHAFAQDFNVRREATANQVLGLVDSMQISQNLPDIFRMVEEIRGLSAFWMEDAFIRSLAEQASARAEEARQQKKLLLQELKLILDALQAARSAAGIQMQLDQAKMLAAEHPEDSDATSELQTIEQTAQGLLRQLETSSSEIRNLTDSIVVASELQQMEDVRQKALQAAAPVAEFEEIADLLRNLERRAEGRRKDHERVSKNVASLAGNAAKVRGPAELDAIRTRARDLIKTWATDSVIVSAVDSLETTLRHRQEELDLSSSLAEAEDPEFESSLEELTVPEPAPPVRPQPRKFPILPVAIGAVVAIAIAAVILFRFAPGTAQFNAPDGVSITVDGKPCASPCRLSLASGTHTAVAHQTNYPDAQSSFAVTSFQTTIVSFERMKSGGEVARVVTANPTSTERAPTSAVPNPQEQKAKVESKDNASPGSTSPGQPAAKGPVSVAGGQQSPVQPPTVTKPVPNPGPAPNPTPVPVSAPSIAAFSSSQQKIEPGQSVTLTWQTQNATEVQINGNSVGINGTFSFTPQGPTVYNLTARGPGGTVNQSLHVDVNVPPVAPQHTEQAGVQEALSRYRQAYESEDMDDVKRVWPTISKNDQKNLKNIFDMFNAIRLTLVCPDDAIHIAGDSATATCQQSATYSVKGKKQNPQSSKTVFALKKQGGSWFVNDMH